MDSEQTTAIYGVLMGIREHLGRLEERSTETLAEVRKTNGRLIKAEEKIDSIDRWRVRVTAVTAAVALLGAAVWELLKTAFGKH